MSEGIRVNRCCPIGCIGDKQIHDNLVSDVEIYKGMLEITTHLKQQAEAEIKILEKNVEVWKKSYTDMHDAQLISVKVIRELEKENNQLKETLKKCSPFTHYNANEVEICYSCEIPYEHKPNCEYIRLIGGDGE